MSQAMQWSMMRGYNSSGDNEIADPTEFDVESTGRSLNNRCGAVPFTFTVFAAFEVQ
jgi:hypothetical protein